MQINKEEIENMGEEWKTEAFENDPNRTFRRTILNDWNEQFSYGLKSISDKDREYV